MLLGGALTVLGGMLQAVRQLVASVAILPFRISFVFFWIVALLFLLFNAELFYGLDADRQRTILMFYMVSLAFVFSSTPAQNPLVGIRTADFVITFALWSIMGAALFTFTQPFNPERALLTSASIGVLLTHALVVAVGEELLFRNALPRLIPGNPLVAQAISAIAFGIMHYVAYSASLANLAFATTLGLLFGVIVVKFPRHGLIIAMALHSTWNLYVLGFI